MKTAICSKCKEEKPLTAEYFYLRTDHLGEFRKECRDCTKKNVSERRTAFRQESFPSPSTKICPRCEEEKSRNDFHKQTGSRDGLQAIYKACTKLQTEEYRRNNPERVKEIQRRSSVKNAESIKLSQARWYQRNRERLLQDEEKRARISVARLRCKYGMTEEQFHNLLDHQQNCCLSCLREFLYENKLDAPCVDHDHATGKVRGLLCNGCNTALGLLRDSPVRAQALARYVTNHLTAA